jgi:hypothetical protein
MQVHPVLRFFFGTWWRAGLTVLFIVVLFASGAVAAIISMLTYVLFLLAVAAILIGIIRTAIFGGRKGH